MRKWVALALSVLFLSGCGLLRPERSASPEVYIVQPGDTVYAIAQRHGVSPEAVLNENKITDPRTLQVGAEVRIPPTPTTGGAPIVSGLATEKTPRASLSAVSLQSVDRAAHTMVWPLERAHLTSKFGRRLLRFHEGIDLSAPEGTPIRAALSGVVVYSGKGIRGYGNTIVVRSGDILTVYAHNKKNLVEVGDEVSQGEEIGTVGRTGRASGPHCHFEVRVKNEKDRFVAVDPLPFFKRDGDD